jgi:hypothetical protein
MNRREDLRQATTPEGWAWLSESVAAVAGNPAAIRGRFPAAGRRVGRGVLPGATPPGGPLFAWTVDDAARALLLDALGTRAGEELEALYRHGDTAERRAVLRWIGWLPDGPAPPGVAAGAICADALRANDPRLLAAALGPWAVRHLDGPVLRQGVLKCVFTGVPLAGLEGLAERADAELARMLAAYVHERVAAGRDVPPDVWPFIDRHPPAAELSAIAAELDHPTEQRRRAARAALAGRQSSTVR